MLVKGTAGVIAQAMDLLGNLIMDFRISLEQNQVHVLNAPSPGSTFSLEIASYITANFLTDVYGEFSNNWSSFHFLGISEGT
jgi:L-2-hydroxyglutarate oxidase